MHLDKTFLISQMPTYQDKWVTVMQKQEVKNIMREIYESHADFRKYYDKIAGFFWTGDIAGTCNNLFTFCRDNIRYVEESEDWQSTALPTGILVRGYGDCKHYASFIAGCLDAISRKICPVDWCYCFASYKLDQRTPYHVFVIVQDGENEIWVDPTPGAGDKEPVWEIRKRV
jgi:hypothetical protein